MEEGLEENRREHLRFRLNVPLYAEFSLWRVREREIRSRKQRVLIHNISVGGCQFSTNLQIPVRDDVEWILNLQLNHNTIKLKAIILHVVPKDGRFAYGVRWVLTGLERQAFQYRLQEYLRLVLVSSVHILTLYKKISDRDVGQFKRLDTTS